MKKTIVIACGAGIATSTVITAKVNEIINENNLDAQIIQCRISEINSYKDQADLIVTSAKVENTYGVPVILGLPFIAGIGMEATTQEILNVLNK